MAKKIFRMRFFEYSANPYDSDGNPLGDDTLSEIKCEYELLDTDTGKHTNTVNGTHSRQFDVTAVVGESYDDRWATAKAQIKTDEGI